jgi:prevent-host-death family protein
MEKAVSAAEANRKFSQLLQDVRRGRSYVVTSHGKPVAKLSPSRRRGEHRSQRTRGSARQITGAASNEGRSLDSGRTVPGFAVRVALDTNVLAYAEGVNGGKRSNGNSQLARGFSSL